MALIIGLVIFALLALGGLYYWWAYRNIESTDDAYTDGRAVVIAPRVAGDVVSLDVTDNQFVTKGQPLIHIDPRQYRIDRELAEGSLETAKHQFAQQQYGVEIGRKNFPAQLDQAQAQPRQRQGQSRQGAVRLRPPARALAAGDDAAGCRRGHGGAQTGAGAGDADLGAGRAKLARAAADRRNRIAGRPVEGADRAGASQARSGRSQPRLDGGRGAAGRLDHQAQCRDGQLCRAGPADFHDRHAGRVGHRELQGDPARPDAPGTTRAHPASTPIPRSSCAAMSTAFNSAPARNSRPFRSRTPPAISSRWCSACRSRSSSTAASIQNCRCRWAFRSSPRSP